MKFGKLMRSTIDARMPQWRDYMINYKALKQALKQLHGSAQGELALPSCGASPAARAEPRPIRPTYPARPHASPAHRALLAASKQPEEILSSFTSLLDEHVAARELLRNQMLQHHLVLDHHTLFQRFPLKSVLFGIFFL